MISLRETLLAAHQALESKRIPHALIGGLALADLGINRATADVDFLAEGDSRADIIACLEGAGFRLERFTEEVLHFEGRGWVDILLARRPISRKMLETAKILSSGVPCLGAEDIIGLKIQAYMNSPKRELRDKADIQELIEKHPNLDWDKVRTYAEMFGQWEEIQKIRGR